MSVYEDIKNQVRQNKLKREIYDNRDKETFPNYRELQIPMFFRDCFLSDRFNGKQFVVNFEMIDFFGFKIIKQLYIDKNNYAYQTSKGVLSLTNAVDEIIRLSQDGFNRNELFMEAIQLINDNKKVTQDVNYKFDPDAHGVLEDFLKKILRTFSQLNAYPENCVVFFGNVDNYGSHKFTANLLPFSHFKGEDLKNKASDYLSVNEYLIKKGLLNEKYILFNYFINETSKNGNSKDIIWSYLEKTGLALDTRVARDYSKSMKDYKYHVLDFEIFKNDWLVVVKEVAINDESQFEVIKEHTIINDVRQLVELSKEMEVVVGFNNKFYDNHILNAIIYSYEFADNKVDLGQPYPFTYTDVKRQEYEEWLSQHEGELREETEDDEGIDNTEDFDIGVNYFKADDLKDYTVIDRLNDMDNFFSRSSGLFQLSNALISKDTNIFSGDRLLYTPYMSLDTRNELALGISLKKIEANLGLDIRESTVPFTIGRKLTKEELEEVVFYCNHDVNTTIKVLNLRFVYFKSLFELCEMFELNDSLVSKTRAALTGEILGCKKKLARYDRLEFDYIDFLKNHKSEDTVKRYDEIYGKYADNAERVKLFNDIISFYRKIENMFMTRKKQMEFTVVNYKNAREEMQRLNEEFDYLVKEYEKMQLAVDIAGVEHKLKFGGIHGAIPNYIGHGVLISLDVTSYYPYLMINNNWVTRNTLFPERVIRIINKRVELKRAKDPQQQILKIVINSLYGVLKAKTSPVCDPVLSNNVCVNGQLALANLILRLSHISTLIQSNTDGIIIDTKEENLDEIRRIYHEWENDFNFNLEEDRITDIYQRDVNSYLVKFDNGKIKSKGRYANIGAINFEKNDKRCIDLAVKDKFTKMCSLMADDNGNKKVLVQNIAKMDYDYMYFLKNLAYKEITAFQILCVQGSTYDTMIHKVYLYDDATQAEKEFIEKIRNSSDFVREYRDEVYKRNIIEYRLQKVNRGIMTKKRVYGQVSKQKAGIKGGIKDYKLDSSGKPVLNELGQFVYNSYSSSLIPDISQNVMIVNKDVRNLTKEEIDELEIDFEYYVNLVSKNDFSLSGNIVTPRDTKNYSNIWQIHEDTTITTVAKSVILMEKMMFKRFYEVASAVTSDYKKVKIGISKMFKTNAIETLGYEDILTKCNDILDNIARFIGTYENDFTNAVSIIEATQNKGNFMSIPYGYSESIEQSIDIIKDSNLNLYNMIEDKKTFYLIELLSKVASKLKTFEAQINSMRNLDIKSSEFKAENKKAYTMYADIKNIAGIPVKALEELKKNSKSFISCGNISENLQQIKDIIGVAFLGDSDTINEMLSNSLMIKGLFSNDSGALVALNLELDSYLTVQAEDVLVNTSDVYDNIGSNKPADNSGYCDNSEENSEWDL